MIRKLVIAMLTFLSLVTGSALIISYAKTIYTNGYYHSTARCRFESRGLMITLRRGQVSFAYSYPVENPIDPAPNLTNTLRQWFKYFGATVECPRCHGRFFPGQTCPVANTAAHAGTFNRMPPPPDAKWDYKLASWVTFKDLPDRASWITINLWFPFTLFTPYPILAFILGPLRRWRRRRIGHCVKCGYNLFGNESGTCPECGINIKTLTNRKPASALSADET